MTTATPQRRDRGFTKWDLLIVILAVVMLVAVFLLLPYVAGYSSMSKSRRITCVLHLKTVGLGLLIYANDHEDRFPWQTPTNAEGSLEYALTGEVFRHFQAASNEIGMTKYLLCPSDTTRVPASNFAPGFGNSNLSYFIGLDASGTNVQMILSGDRLITVNGNARTGVVSVFSTNVVGWSSLLHGGHGNIGLADGSVQQVSPGALQSQAGAAQAPVFRLAIP